ncbi:MAG: hypothetical protein LBK27_05950 [Treponema sp.]|jgi:hypothetical protein|nr:hypothetical protein [Treponema sp.]
MLKRGLRAALPILFGFFCTLVSVSQENAAEDGEMNRGSIPEVLLRPQRGEAPRYPVDTVIGPLGRGEASGAAYLFARKVSAALIAGNRNDPSLLGMNSVLREALVSELNGINPQSWRLGSGREEPDGAVSFLVRFLGRERGITGELYIRPQVFEPPEDPPGPDGTEAAAETDQSGAEAAAEPAGTAAEVDQTAAAGPAQDAGPDAAPGTEIPATAGPVVWVFEDLLLEEARERAVEGDRHRFDFPPYERLF